MTQIERTDWRRVTVTLLAGVALATQVGKIPPALPLLREALEMDLFTAAATVSLFSVLLGLFGLTLGLIVGRVGIYRAALFGMIVTASAGLFASQVDSASALLASRVAEGFGFIFAVAALPALVASACSPRDKSVAMGLWGGFVPAGVTLIMLIAAAGLAQLDWRGLWQVGAALILLAAAALHWGWREHAAQPGQRGASEPLRIAFQRGPLLLAACFACYSAQFLGVVSFLPGVLQQQAGLSPTSASVIVALAVSLNILGNLASGWLMQHGLRPRQLLTIGALATLLSSIPLFAAEGMLPVQIACACLFTGLSGLIPGAAFAAVPAYAERPSQLPIFNGMLMQGVGIGQTIGPLLLAGVVEMLGGWQWAWVSIAIFSVFALTATAALPKAN